MDGPRTPNDPPVVTLMTTLRLTPDVAFASPIETEGVGVFGYIHRQRVGREIYYFGNASDTPVDTVVTVRGRLERGAYWNPHDGKTSPLQALRYQDGPEGPMTEFRLAVGALSSLAVVGTLK